MNCEYLDFTNCIDYDKLQQASQSLVDGNLVVFPTDTVYGIGCNPFKEEAISNLFRTKDRPSTKPIIVLISSFEMLNSLTSNVTENEYKLMKAFWPGPLTIILKKNSALPTSLTSGLDTIGVRMPNNKIALELIQNAGIPIATSSANISNNAASTTISGIKEIFHNNTSFMIDCGISAIGIASTIVRLEDNHVNILREGTISKFDIEKVIERS